MNESVDVVREKRRANWGTMGKWTKRRNKRVRKEKQ